MNVGCELASNAPKQRELAASAAAERRTRRAIYERGSASENASTAMKFIASAVVAWLALVLPVAGIAGPEATPKPSWTCIRGVCVGTTVAAMVERYGPDWATPYDGAVSAGIAVPGGRVYVTNVGDLCRATKRITTISTSDPIVRLPDGVRIGTKIPSRAKWRGYTQVKSAWRKPLSVKGAKVEVKLETVEGRVAGVRLTLGWNLRCGS